MTRNAAVTLIELAACYAVLNYLVGVLRTRYGWEFFSMSERKTEAELRAVLDAPGPQPYEPYRHRNGDLYVVVARSVGLSDHEPLVTYRAVRSGLTWTRPLREFIDRFVAV